MGMNSSALWLMSQVKVTCMENLSTCKDKARINTTSYCVTFPLKKFSLPVDLFMQFIQFSTLFFFFFYQFFLRPFKLLFLLQLVCFQWLHLLNMNGSLFLLVSSLVYYSTLLITNLVYWTIWSCFQNTHVLIQNYSCMILASCSTDAGIELLMYRRVCTVFGEGGGGGGSRCKYVTWTKSST